MTSCLCITLTGGSTVHYLHIHALCVGKHEVADRVYIVGDKLELRILQQRKRQEQVELGEAFWGGNASSGAGSASKGGRRSRSRRRRSGRRSASRRKSPRT